MRRIQKKLGEILIDKGLISAEQLDLALKEQAKTNELLGAILLKKGFLSEKNLLEAFSEQFGIAVVSLKSKYIDWSMVRKFPPSLILDHGCIPLGRDEWSVTMAITDPLDVWAIKRAEEAVAGFNLKLVLVTRADMNEAQARFTQLVRADIKKRFK